MIRQIGKCPYCETVVAADFINSKLVFNPHSHRPVCDHVVYVDGLITYWEEDRTRIDCAMNLVYESAEVSKLRDEFDLREYMSKLRQKDNVDPRFEYVANEFMRERIDCVDFSAWLVFTRDASSFFQACEVDWTSRHRTE